MDARDRLAVHEEVPAERRGGVAHHRVHRVLQLLRRQATRLAAQGHAVGLELALDELEARLEPLRRRGGVKRDDLFGGVDDDLRQRLHDLRDVLQ
jgi:hypothetical protein